MAYHFNWSREAVLAMPHHERQRWCEEISAINERINQESGAGPGASGPGGPGGGPGASGGSGAPTLEQEIPDEFFEDEES